jgi:hypothetical protein
MRPTSLIPLILILAGCASPGPRPPMPPSSPGGTGGQPVPTPPPTPTPTPGTGGSGGATPEPSPPPAAPDASPKPDSGPVADAGPSAAPGTGTGQPPNGVVPPIIPDECPGDLAAGMTEYKDTFKVQHPYDLKPEERYSLMDGIYAIWVMKGDKPHEPGNTTRERTEFRWSDMSSGTYLWTGDFKVQNDSQHVCIFQVKNSGPPTGVYLRVDGGNLHQLNGGNFLSGIYDKWYNLKVVVDTGAATGKVYINNCLKQTVNMPRGSGTWYFKNGTYTCDSTLCKAFFKNIHTYKK